MVLMEENGDKAALVLDRDPEGLCHIVEKSQILEASHVKEVSDSSSVCLRVKTSCYLNIKYWFFCQSETEFKGLVSQVGIKVEQFNISKLTD